MRDDSGRRSRPGANPGGSRPRANFASRAAEFGEFIEPLWTAIVSDGFPNSPLHLIQGEILRDICYLVNVVNGQPIESFTINTR